MIRIGDKVIMTEDAIENYGEEYRGREFVVESVATKYMTAKQFYAEGMPDGYHPGYDEGVGGNLYDLVDFRSSLYDWEIRLV